VEVWIVLWIYVFEFWMKCRVAGAGQAGIAFVNLDEWIAFMEVGVVVVSWQPSCNCAAGALVLSFSEYILIVMFKSAQPRST
jgi:hypothetical protein